MVYSTENGAYFQKLSDKSKISGKRQMMGIIVGNCEKGK